MLKISYDYSDYHGSEVDMSVQRNNNRLVQVLIQIGNDLWIELTIEGILHPMWGCVCDLLSPPLLKPV